MGIEFGRGAFENPDDPAHHDDVDASILVVTAPEHRGAAGRAVERCRDRWRGIDGAGRFHGPDDVAFWEAQPDQHGLEWHTAKYVSDVRVEAEGVVVAVDVQGLMPEAMRAAYREVLVEELTAAGVAEAFVRSVHEDDHEPISPPTAGPWPLYPDSDVPGLPPGVPPGRVFHQDLRRHRRFRNWLLQRDFDDVWEANAVAAAGQGGEGVVREACRRFEADGWAVGEPRATVDWDGKPLVAAAMSIDGAVAVVSTQQARHAGGRGLRVPKDTEHVVTAVAYYDVAGRGL